MRWIRESLAKATTLHDLDVMMAIVCKSIAQDEFYSDEEMAAALRLAAKSYDKRKEAIK
jgi:hypothetical protein